MKPVAIKIAILAVLVSGCMRALALDPIKVLGNAMLPALKDGDQILIDRRFEKLERGDIVIFYFPQDRSVSYIKRIVGLPGETVEIQDSQILINGNPLQEPYVNAQYNQSARSLAPITLPDDRYFVAGDNRDNSSDSRIWGPLQKDLIYGKYTRKYYSAR